MILSGLAAGAPWLCYYRAVQIGQVPRMVPIDRLSVALTLIRSVLLLYEQFTWKSGGLFCSQWERW
ncbi:EamA family transporter [Clostridium sp. M62/1]|uniref:EamA family transporter n=1 Tax=Clostridium sp. M62/1 TaxID=411486 RepID=UPI003562551E